jgi:hypothetical protein
MRTRINVAPALALALLVAAIVGGVGWNIARTSPKPASRQLINQPETWTPFVADLITTQPGAPDMKGSYARSSDGSFRMEQRTEDGSVIMISVANIRDGRAYIYNSQPDKWISRPLLIPPAGYRPPKPRTVDSKGVSLHTEKIENLEVYRVEGPTGEVTFEAPLLNGYALITFGTSGQATTLRNIQLREPPTGLFDLPAGVTPEFVSKGIPMGIRMSGGTDGRVTPVPEPHR